MNDAIRTRSSRDEAGRTRNLEWPPQPEPLPLPVVDNHAHLDYGDAHRQLSIEEHLRKAHSAGISGIITIGCDLEAARWTIEALEAQGVPDSDKEFRRARLRGGVSIHPNDAVSHVMGVDRHGRSLPSLEDAIADIAQMLDHDGIVTVGETGLDWFRTSKRKPEHRDAQILSFRMHIALAHEKNLPMQIHDRDAHRDVFDVLDRDGTPDRTVFHCFSGDADVAREALARGAYLSFAGTLTFANAPHLREALAITPLERILVETDAPFLTPEPYRGRPNSSYLMAHTTRAIAEIKGVSVERVCEAIRATTLEVYGWAGA